MLTSRVWKALAFYILVVFVILCFAWSYPRGNKTLDFGSFVAAGRAASEGKNPYGVYDLTPAFKQGDVVGYAVNRNPPISVLIFEPISHFDPVVAFRTWYFISLAIYALVILLLIRAYREYAAPLRIVWALGLAGVWSTVNLGQIYVPLVLAAVGAWLCLRQRHNVLAGLLLGALVAVKPNFAVWPVLLLLAGYWAPSIVAFISAGLLSLAPALVYGPGIYVAWLGTFSSHPWIGYPTNGSLIGLAARLGILWLGVALGAALLIALTVWAYRGQLTILEVSSLALIGSLLASPEAWSGYTLFLLPVIWYRSWTPLVTTVAILLMAPDTVVMDLTRLSPWYFAAFAHLANVALLLLFVAVIAEARMNDRVPLASEKIAAEMRAASESMGPRALTDGVVAPIVLGGHRDVGMADMWANDP